MLKDKKCKVTQIRLPDKYKLPYTKYLTHTLHTLTLVVLGSKILRTRVGFILSCSFLKLPGSNFEK